MPPRGTPNLRNTLVCGLAWGSDQARERTMSIKADYADYADYVRFIMCLVFLPRAALFILATIQCSRAFCVKRPLLTSWTIEKSWNSGFKLPLPWNHARPGSAQRELTELTVAFYEKSLLWTLAINDIFINSKDVYSIMVNFWIGNLNERYRTSVHCAEVQILNYFFPFFCLMKSQVKYLQVIIFKSFSISTVCDVELSV